MKRAEMSGSSQLRLLHVGQQDDRDPKAKVETRPGVTRATRRTADNRDRDTSESQGRVPPDRDTPVIASTEHAAGSTQSKITQFIQQERAAHAQINEPRLALKRYSVETIRAMMKMRSSRQMIVRSQRSL